MDTRGYSKQTIKANAEADQKLPGVKLGRFCIRRDIPVAFVSEKLGVSRASIYRWFLGEWGPRQAHIAKIEAFLKEYR
ncbi:MAG: XRE family transcriptional regulator [Altererythrobacter sp.]|jgi:hypothetical protein|nr:XRE family transcriptional regulator [Altererythrobacter sp.]